MRHARTFYVSLAAVAAIAAFAAGPSNGDSQAPAKGIAEQPSITSILAQVKQVSDSFPDKLVEGTDEQYEAWRLADYKLRARRIELIEALEKTNLPQDQLKPYLRTKIEDIERCFHYARNEANKFESKIWHMAEEGAPDIKILAEELHWQLNVWHINTHAMALSETDQQKIADFETSRKDRPEAGRLLAYAIATGRVGPEAKAKWSTWILANFPPDCEGYQKVTATGLLQNSLGKPFHFTGKDPNGRTIDSESFKGKVVLLEFWAFWCGICVEEIPLLKDLDQAYRDRGLQVIGVFNDHRIAELRTYVKEKNIPWPQLVDESLTKSSFMHPLARKYGFTGLPRYLLIGRDGQLKKTGVRVELLKPTIVELLAQ